MRTLVCISRQRSTLYTPTYKKVTPHLHLLTFILSSSSSHLYPLAFIHPLSLSLCYHSMLVTYKTSGGGFRRLVNLNTNTVLAAQTFYSVESSRSVEFRFDYQPPTHCGETSSCTNGENMLTVSEVTRVSLLL